MTKLTSEIRKDKKWFVIITILITLLILDSIVLIANIGGLYSIENTLRFIGCVIILLFTLLMMFLGVKSLLKRKKWAYIVLTIVSIIYIGIVGFVNINFNIIYGNLNKVTSNYTTYSISLVTLSSNDVDNISNIGDNEIGIINDHEIANGYTFGEDILNNKKMTNKLKEYESYINIIDDLLNGNIKYAFLPSNYIESFSTIEGYENIGTKLKTIYEQSKQEEQVSSNKDITEPFTMLLMGVDSTEDEIANATANGDSLMLITFNPKTLSATMVSIPRDSYVPITCMGNKKNKITHSSWGGESCIINTIENFTGVDIDYYAKINFTGLVKLVDTLGGINVNVEYSFCEQNSKRQFGDSTVYVKEGEQTLDGEQALAYARNRHPNPEYCSKEWTNYNSNDFIRGQHQQDIIKGILSKLKDVKDLDTFYGILDTISSNMETNMESNTILSFYNVAKDIIKKTKDAKTVDDLVNIQKLYLSGYSAMIYDYSQNTNTGMRMVLYDFVPYKGSIEDIVEAMNVNLGKSDRKVVKSFSFDINDPYEEKVIGKGSYSESTVTLLPDFTGKTKSYVESYANAHGIKLSIITQSSTSKANTVISQDPPAQMDIDALSSTKGLTIYVSGNSLTTTETTDYSVCKDSDYATNSICSLNFSNKTLSYYKTTVKNRYQSTFDELNIKYTVKEETETNDEETFIVEVDGKETTGTNYIYSLKGKEIVVHYYKAESKTQEEPKPSTGDTTATSSAASPTSSPIE